jgi:hypothetical protein
MGTISVSLPSDGTTADVADYNTPINTIVTLVNGNLDNANIASGAAIAGSKLASDGVTGTQIQLGNNDALNALNASSVEKALLKLGTDDILRLSQMRFQLDTTNSTQENVIMQAGWGWKIGDGTNSIAETVTFPTAITTVLTVIPGLLGTLGSDPAAIGDLTSGLPGAIGWSVSADDIATTGFTVTMSRNTGTFSAGTRYGYSWIAFGVKT